MCNAELSSGYDGAGLPDQAHIDTAASPHIYRMCERFASLKVADDINQ